MKTRTQDPFAGHAQQNQGGLGQQTANKKHPTPSMEKTPSEIYDKYIKALMDISQAITSDFYIEEILKLIVMVTAKVTGVPQRLRDFARGIDLLCVGVDQHFQHHFGMIAGCPTSNVLPIQLAQFHLLYCGIHYPYQMAWLYLFF